MARYQVTQMCFLKNRRWREGDVVEAKFAKPEDVPPYLEPLDDEEEEQETGRSAKGKKGKKNKPHPDELEDPEDGDGVDDSVI